MQLLSELLQPQPASSDTASISTLASLTQGAGSAKAHRKVMSLKGLLTISSWQVTSSPCHVLNPHQQGKARRTQLEHTHTHTFCLKLPLLHTCREVQAEHTAGMLNYPTLNYPTHPGHAARKNFYSKNDSGYQTH